MNEGGESDALAILDGLEEAIADFDPAETQLRSVNPLDHGSQPAAVGEARPEEVTASVAHIPAAPPTPKPIALRRYPDPPPRPAGVRPTVASCAAVLERFHWGESR
jgi:hypothetical protein